MLSRLFLSVLVILVVSSTIYEFWRKKHSQFKILEAFSLQKNWKSLTKSSDSNSIDCINGLRVLSAFWIIAGHRKKFYQEMTESISYNLVEEGISFIIYLHQYAVDTFMVISGYLLTLSCLKVIKRWKKSWWIMNNKLTQLKRNFSENFNYFKLCLKRYLRYAPSVIVLFAFYTSSLSNLLISGPKADYLTYEQEQCLKFWWANVLMIQNFINLEVK